MSLQSVPTTAAATNRTSLEAVRAAVRELQGLKSAVVAGAAAARDIAVAGIATVDTLVAVIDLGVPEAVKSVLATGAAATRDVAVAGIARGDRIVSAIVLGSAPDDVSDEITISGDGTVQFGRTDTSARLVQVIFASAASAGADRTAEASITRAGVIQLATTPTTGHLLLVLYTDRPS